MQGGGADGPMTLIKIELAPQPRRAIEVLIGGDHGSGPVRHGVLSTGMKRVWVLGQPLTEPAAMPSTIFRLKKMNMINGGMVTSKIVANSRLYWVVNWLWKFSRVS